MIEFFRKEPEKKSTKSLETVSLEETYNYVSEKEAGFLSRVGKNKKAINLIVGLMFTTFGAGTGCITSGGRIILDNRIIYEAERTAERNRTIPIANRLEADIKASEDRAKEIEAGRKDAEEYIRKGGYVTCSNAEIKGLDRFNEAERRKCEERRRIEREGRTQGRIEGYR